MKQFTRGLSAVLAVTMLSSFVTCRNQKNKIDETTTEKITTTMVTTTAMPKPIAKVTSIEKPEAIATTKAVTTQSVTYTTAVATTTMVTTEKVTAETTDETTQEVTTVTEEAAEEPTSEKAIAQREIEDEEYKKLLNELNYELSKKNYSKEVNLLFVDTLELLYDNYPAWQYGYKDMPDREEYIKTNLIDVIKNIDIIDFYKQGSKEAIAMEEMGYPYAWTTYDEDRNLCLGIIAVEADKAGKMERARDAECFYHEIIHCKQDYLMDYVNDYFVGNEKVEQLYLEGGATFHMKFTCQFNLDVGGIWSIENEKGDRIIEYYKNNSNGYLIDLNGYEKLIYLVGYNTMDKIERGELPLSAVEETIANKYGEEQARKFIETLGAWYSGYDENYKGDAIYELAVDLEKQFLAFLKQDIEALKTKEEAEEFKRVYDFYMRRNLPIILDETGRHDMELTIEIFDIDTLEALMEEKLK